MSGARERAQRKCLCALLSLVVFVAVRASFASELIVTPGPDGRVGLWLVAGPLHGSESGLRFTTQRGGDHDNRSLVEIKSGATVLPGRDLGLIAGRNGQFDLRKILRAPREDSYALFASILRATQQCTVWLQLGADDGVRVTLDGQDVYSRDLRRPFLHEDEAIKLTLSPGDHALLIRLRQRSGDWYFRARLLDSVDLQPPRSVAIVLPGVGDDVARTKIADSIELAIGLEVGSDWYRPTVRVSAAGGLPSNAKVPITVSGFAREDQEKRRPLFRADLGQLPVGPRRVHPMLATLPMVSAQALRLDERELPMEIEVTVAGQTTRVERRGDPTIGLAIATIDEAIEPIQAGSVTLRDAAVVQASLELARSRLTAFVSEGDEDLAATVEEAKEVTRFAREVVEGRDPLFAMKGALRLAYRSPLDGKNRPFGVYIPPTLGQDRAKQIYPLVVVLHGMNGLPMQMIRIFFGHDDWRRAPWEDRHVGKLADLDAFVVSPSGFGNVAYSEFGEIDVMHLVSWMRQTYPIDANRVYITGLSMGGTGTGAIGLRYADQFAAFEPLCGYHSYALRRDMANVRLRPWERDLASFWSNVSWADNGRNLPLFVVHGKKDKPVANSEVLIDRYNALGYSVYAERPDVGHNVWQQTYAHFKGYGWLARHRRDPQPKEVVLRTSSLRYADHSWVHVLRLEKHLSWGRVRARVQSRNRITAETSGVRALRLDRPNNHVDMAAPLILEVDGQSMSFEPNVPVEVHRPSNEWVAGAAPKPSGLYKRRGLTGPIRDAFLEPLVFVVGTQDPSLTFANEQVAEALAHPPFGVEARWPVVADVDVTTAMAAGHSLYLVGSARSNAYVARIADRLPIRVNGNEVVAGSHRFSGTELGTLFVHPNPQHPERYIVVLAAPDVAGTLRALSLPRMLPDFVIYDQQVAGARGQIVLGAASLLAGGNFDESWQLPSVLNEPVDWTR